MMKIKVNSKRLELNLRCRDWYLATKVILHNRTQPPMGYKVLSASLKNRSQSGARCELRIHFMHVDRDNAPFTYVEACEFFEVDKAVANGEGTYAEVLVEIVESTAGF